MSFLCGGRRALAAEVGGSFSVRLRDLGGPLSAAGQDDDGASLAFRTVAWGRRGHLVALAARPPSVDVRTSPGGFAQGGDGFGFTEWEHSGLTENWSTIDGGFEQRWMIWTEPKGAGPITLVVEVWGARPAAAADGGVRLGLGDAEIEYGAPRAWDALGLEIPAYVRVAGSRIEVVVDAEGALLPIMVDPTLTQCDWSVRPDPTVNPALGGSVSIAGDLDGDTFPDLALGVSREFIHTNSGSEGRVWVYGGSASGPSESPDWTAVGTHSWECFGRAVAAAGDVNGDGYADLAVAAESSLNDGATAAMVYLGGPAGLASSWDWRVEPYTPPAYSDEISVASAGDVNGDGFDDLVVGAEAFTDHAEWRGGAVFVYHGSSSGLAASPDWAVFASYGSSLGSSVAGAGDVNGDGFDDLLVGDRLWDGPGWKEGSFADQGAAFLYLGSSSGLASSPAWMATGEYPDSYNGIRLGETVSAAGDVNADGFADILVGAPGHETSWHQEGAAYVYLGSPTGPSPVADWTYEGAARWALFGRSLSSAGDFDADGYDDIVIGAEWLPNAMGEDDSRSWAVFIFMGGALGVEPTPEWTATGMGLDPAQPSLGVDVSGGGDVNGDGWDDLLIGSPASSSAGAVCLVLGRDRSSPADDDSADDDSAADDDLAADDDSAADDDTTGEPGMETPPPSGGGDCGCGGASPATLPLLLVLRWTHRRQRLLTGRVR